MSARHCLFFLILSVFGISAAVAQQISAPEPQAGTIIGTVTDANGGTVPGAGVALECTSLRDRERVETNNNGFFQLEHVNSGIPYHVTVSASGFANWTSPAVILRPGQYLELTGIQLQVARAVTTVTAVVSTEQIAREQEKVEEQQRVLGFIPNFYVTYDRNAVPLTPRLKFRLALKTSVDPITFVGSAFLAGLDQAADVHSYGQGAKGYGQRFGANYANALTDIMIGGAILPSLLHQDPRYFYQGTGTTGSRIRHAMLSPFVARGDNGRWQPNYSSIGGDLASSALSNLYYPQANRGAGLMFGNFAIGTAERIGASLAQEFIIGKFTRRRRHTE